MSKPWETLEQRPTPDGLLELRRRDADDFLILVSGRVLMNSRQSRSEEVLGVSACASVPEGGRILVGGLGMGMTLRAVLDSAPQAKAVVVAELHKVIVKWCRGPLAELTDSAVLDPRVCVEMSDVADCIQASAGPDKTRYSAIVIDLFEGPHARTHPKRDPLYGQAAISRTWGALEPGGVFGVWAEAKDEAFEARLRRQGFSVEAKKPGRGGLRHWVVLARKPESAKV